uniref:Uncharacterized protein n=1 Tax=Romanomermis culicivorax TaxID=13658 RepID=A0A915J358_ROMCU
MKLTFTRPLELANRKNLFDVSNDYANRRPLYHFAILDLKFGRRRWCATIAKPSVLHVRARKASPCRRRH